MNSSLAHDLKLRLHQQGPLRVWSVIVTIMGDLVETIGGEITIAEMIEICTKLDIEPQAVRTAMSRLMKEGWVERIPHGRSTKYRFSDERRGEFNTATRTIYASPFHARKEWQFGVLPLWPQAKKRALIASMEMVHPIIINQQIVIWPKSYDHMMPKTCRDVLTIFDKMPMAISKDALDDVSPPPHAELINSLCDVVDTVTMSNMISAEDALIIRIVLIHFWRRLVLRHIHISGPFDEVFWPLPRLHRAMAVLYPILAEQSAAALANDINHEIVIERFQHTAPNTAEG